MKTPPPTFSITFTASDVATAAPYLHCTNCLVGTALRRNGYDDVCVGGTRVRVGKSQYSFDGDIVYDSLLPGHTKPFYDVSVVGKTLTFTQEGK